MAPLIWGFPGPRTIKKYSVVRKPLSILQFQPEQTKALDMGTLPTDEHKCLKKFFIKKKYSKVQNSHLCLKRTLEKE